MKNKPFSKPNKPTIFSFASLFFTSILCLTFAIISPANALAAEVSFRWDSNDQATGYNLHYGFASGSYEDIEDLGSCTEYTFPIPDNNRPYYFALTAYNDYGESDYSEEQVYDPDHDSDNQSPTADAERDQTVDEFAEVTLDGSKSSDPDDGIEWFYWEQQDGPLVDLADQWDEVTTFTAPAGFADGTSLTFKLTISDHSGLQSQDSCTVTINSVSNETADTVKVTTALYNMSKKKLTVKATSDAPANSVRLTVWADFNGIEVNIGNLQYSGKKNTYLGEFENVNTVPNNVTVESSGGGSGTRPCFFIY